MTFTTAQSPGPNEQHRLLDKAGLRCEVWGVLNVTPDSFSDGGDYFEPDKAYARALTMLDEGADVVDVGGQSTRPAGNTYGEGFQKVDAEEESRRVCSIVERLVKARNARISVDTTQVDVARRALDAGVQIINDTSCAASAALLTLVAERGVEIVLMHNRGGGQVDPINARYDCLFDDVIRELRVAIAHATQAGIAADRIWLDPGLGFAKFAQGSLELTANIQKLSALGFRTLIGASRKSFIAQTLQARGFDHMAPKARLAGSLVAALYAASRGVNAVRVHDVYETKQALGMLNALNGAQDATTGEGALAAEMYL